MYVTTHLFAGAFIGAVLQNPVLAGIGGFCSHALLDAIPHHDYQRPIPAAVDIGLSLAALFMLNKSAGSLAFTKNPALIGGFMATLPDIEVGLSFLAGPKRRWRLIYPSHSGLLTHGKMAFPMGFLLQLAIVLLAAMGIHYVL